MNFTEILKPNWNGFYFNKDIRGHGLKKKICFACGEEKLNGAPPPGGLNLSVFTRENLCPKTIFLTTDFSRNFTEILKPIRNGFYFNKGSIGHGLTLMNTDK
jgi:hypothetical protein